MKPLSEHDALAHVRAALGPAAFQTLESFVGLCESWGAVSNLVSAGDRGRLWSRHIVDSLQLVDFARDCGPTWIDLGAGAGFPGVVVAIARVETSMTLVDANKKKAAFLNRVVAQCGLNARVESKRTEALPPKPYDVVSARALAPLHRLFPLVAPFFGPATVGLFPKGRDAGTEIEMARETFRFDLTRHPSRTDDDGTILAVTNLQRA